MKDEKEKSSESSTEEEVEKQKQDDDEEIDEEETDEESSEDSSDDDSSDDDSSDEASVSEDDKTPTPSAPESEEKTIPYSRFKEINSKYQDLKKEKEKKEREKKSKDNTSSNSSLDIDDYIDISTSLDGLDSREKAYLSEQHKLSSKPMSEIRDSEDFKFWQSAYRKKVAKEKQTLKPSNKQSESDKPKTLGEKLSDANNVEDKEKILSEVGYYKSPRKKKDRVRIDKME